MRTHNGKLAITTNCNHAELFSLWTSWFRNKLKLRPQNGGHIIFFVILCVKSVDIHYPLNKIQTKFQDFTYVWFSNSLKKIWSSQTMILQSNRDIQKFITQYFSMRHLFSIFYISTRSFMINYSILRSQTPWPLVASIQLFL